MDRRGRARTGAPPRSTPRCVESRRTSPLLPRTTRAQKERSPPRTVGRPVPQQVRCEAMDRRCFRRTVLYQAIVDPKPHHRRIGARRCATSESTSRLQDPQWRPSRAPLDRGERTPLGTTDRGRGSREDASEILCGTRYGRRRGRETTRSSAWLEACRAEDRVRGRRFVPCRDPGGGTGRPGAQLLTTFVNVTTGNATGAAPNERVERKERSHDGPRQPAPAQELRAQRTSWSGKR